MNGDLLSLDLFRWGKPKAIKIQEPSQSANAMLRTFDIWRPHSRHIASISPSESEDEDADEDRPPERPGLPRRVISQNGKVEGNGAPARIPHSSAAYSTQVDGLSYEGREGHAPQLRNRLSATYSTNLVPIPPRRSWVNATGQTLRERPPGDTGRPSLPMSYPHRQAMLNICHSFVRPLQPPATRFAFGESPASLREALEEEGDDEKWPPTHDPDISSGVPLHDDFHLIQPIRDNVRHRRNAADNIKVQEDDWEVIERAEDDAELQRITGIGEDNLTFYARLGLEYLSKLTGLMLTSVEESARYSHSRQEKSLSQEAWHYIGQDWRSSGKK